MRIIHWCSSFLAGGAVAETVLGLANAQTVLGHDVMVVSREHGNNPAYNPRLRTDLRAELHTWDPSRTLMLGRLPASLVPRRSIDVLRKYRADILHMHIGILPEDALARRVILRTRAVLTPHGAFYPQVLGRKLVPYLAVLRPFFYSSLSAFHALSPGEAKVIEGIFRRQEIYVVPNGVSAGFGFHPSRNFDRADTPNGVIKFIYVGRLDIRTKGLDILLHSFARAAAQSPQRLELVLVGPRSGTDYVSVLSIINELAIGDRVFLTGTTDREGVARYLKTADVFVQTSQWDACSLSSIEAITLELPCILTSRNGVSTYSNIASLPHIHVIEPRVEQATAAMLEVVSSLHVQRESAKQFGPAAREFFSWERAAANHDRAYARLIAAN